MIYLDSSALLKMLFDEGESEALSQWLTSRTGVSKISSELSKIEVVRACRRIDEDVVPSARRLLAGLDLVPISGEAVERAELVGDPTVRNLDAIHLASALQLRSHLSAFFTYDFGVCGRQPSRKSWQ